MSDFDDRVRNLMRELTDEDAERHEPPASIWEAIAGEVGIDADSDVDDDAVADPIGDDAVADVGPGAPATVHRLADRRPRWSTWALGAAAAVVAVIAAAVVLDIGGGDEPDVLASVEVSSDGLDDAPVGLQTRATIEQANGARAVVIDASGVPVGDGEFLELWLINDDISDMVSLGMISAGRSYQIPADVVLGDFPIIDVSVEPDDGNPLHSGRSVLRGRLDA